MFFQAVVARKKKGSTAPLALIDQDAARGAFTPWGKEERRMARRGDFSNPKVDSQ